MELNFKNIKKILFIISFTIIFFTGLTNIHSVLNAAGTIFGILTPFIVGLCIAFIVNVLLKFIEKIWDKLLIKHRGGLSDRIKRPICILISFLVIIGAVFILFFMVIPEVVRTFYEISQIMPYYFERLEIWYNSISDDLESMYVSLPNINIEWKQVSATIIDFLTRGGKTIFNTTLGITASIFSGVFTAVISIIFSIYILFNKETLGRQIRKILYAYIRKDRVDSFLNIMKVTERTFAGFVTGQLTEAVIIGLLCFIGMNIFSFPYSTMIAALVGFTALIPLVGAFIGTSVGALLIIMVSPIKALWFVVFIIVLQQLEGNIIYPRVVGKSVGLPGMWVLVAITLGGNILGIVGMLLSVPLCSVLYALLKKAVNARLAEKKIEICKEKKEELIEEANDEIIENNIDKEA